MDFIGGDKKDFKVERTGPGDADFKLTCRHCEKPMVDAKEFAEYLKTAMLAVLKENGGDIDDPELEEKTRKKMEQLKICLHGGYEGIGFALDMRNGKVEKVYETEKPDMHIEREMIPPTKQDEMWDQIAKRFAPIFINMKNRGKSTDEVLHDLKYVCFNVLGFKMEGFTEREFDNALRPMIEAAGKE